MGRHAEEGSRRSCACIQEILGVAFICLVFLIASQARGETIVLDAEQDCESDRVTRFLNAGSYTVTPIDQTAWNSWDGTSAGCDTDGKNCTKGWLTNYSISSSHLSPIHVNTGQIFEDEEDAFDNAASTQFTLPEDPGAEPYTVEFYINDATPFDNTGGVSLDLVWSAADTDSDGIPDASDNCTDIPNAAPLDCDTDNDGYGNICDGDFDNSGTVNPGDYSLYFLPDYLAGTDSGIGSDMDCWGSVNNGDWQLFFLRLPIGVPGPSGLACAGTTPCP